MISTFLNSFKVSFVKEANTFIYFLKRLPIIGKRIPNSLYKRTDSKLIIGIIKEFLGILGGFIGKSLYIGIMILLPAYLISTIHPNSLLPNFLLIFLFLSLLIGPLIKPNIFNLNNTSAFDMITLMRCDAKKYYLSEILYKNISDYIYFVLPLIIIGLFIGLAPVNAFVLILEVVALRFIGEWLHLFVYTKTRNALIQNNIFMFSVILVGLGLAYALPLMGYSLSLKFLFNGFFILVLLLLSAAACIYLWNYDEYTAISKTFLNRTKLNNREALKIDMNFASVKLNEKKMSKADLNTKAYNKKTGYEYLNAIFFLRHRKIMVYPIKIRIAIISVLTIVGLYFTLFIPSGRLELIKAIGTSTPLFVFIMYSMSTGDRVCKAMFFNCDVSLLRYPFYREGSVILSNFTSRLKRLVLLNLIPALALCLGIFVIVLASGSLGKSSAILPLFLCILSLSCFFSIHHLFMYYVLQPYTKELTVNSPLFKVVNSIIYIISFTCLQVKTSSYIFTFAVLAFTIIYMFVALILTYKVAPKSFKLK